MRVELETDFATYSEKSIEKGGGQMKSLVVSKYLTVVDARHKVKNLICAVIAFWTKQKLATLSYVILFFKANSYEISGGK